MPRLKDQAICIRLIDWSETSQIVALLTEHHGKLRGLAKGSKRTSPSSVARYSGGIELLTLGQAVGTIKPTAELATLTEWDLQDPYPHLRQNLRAQQLAMYAADITAALLADHDPHPRVYTALAALLAGLANPNRHSAELLRFQWQLLEDCGYRPQLLHDVRTGKPIAPNSSTHHEPNQDGYYTFDLHAGGLTIQPAPPPTNSKPAGTIDNNLWRVSPATIALLRRGLNGNTPTTDPTPPISNDTNIFDTADTPTIDRANRLLCAYIRAVLDKQLPTMIYIQNTNGSPNPGALATKNR